MLQHLAVAALSRQDVGLHAVDAVKISGRQLLDDAGGGDDASEASSSSRRVLGVGVGVFLLAFFL